MYYFLIFVILFGLLPFVSYLVLYKKLTKETRHIQLFLISIFVASLYEFVFSFLLKINVEYWFTAYTVLAFVSIHYFFYLLLDKKYKMLFTGFIVLFLTFLFCSYTVWRDVYYLDICSYFNTLQTLIILTFSILWFRRVFNNLELESFSDSPSFYFVSGLIIYYSGTVFLFLISSSILKMEKDTFFEYWVLNIILNLVFRTLIIIGIWKGRLK